MAAHIVSVAWLSPIGIIFPRLTTHGCLRQRCRGNKSDKRKCLSASSYPQPQAAANTHNRSWSATGEILSGSTSARHLSVTPSL
jgi:hypothetical protein